MTGVKNRIERLLHRLQRENDLLMDLLESGLTPKEAEERLQRCADTSGDQDTDREARLESSSLGEP